MSTTAQDVRLLLRMWLRNPRHVAALAPSSQGLGRLMAKHVPPHGERFVVELGAGTGAVTQALLAAGVSRDHLAIVERDATLVEVLKQRFPGVRIIHGDAMHLRRLLRSHGVTAVACVVSSLPLLTLPPLTRLAVLRESFKVLADDGVLVQYTYGFLSPLASKRRRQLGIFGRCVGRVWRNVPPATVWTYRRIETLGALN